MNVSRGLNTMVQLSWVILLAASAACSAFLGCKICRTGRSKILFRLRYSIDSQFMDEFRSRKEQLEVEKERIRLEEANKQAFKKAAV